MKLKKLLTLTLAGTLLVSGIATVNAAELDVAWYAAKNPDVVAAFGNSPEMLKLHYEMFGRKEARMANTHDVEAQLRKMFNPTEYATLYPDVKAALGENAEAMFQHYMAFGLLESRRPSEKVSKETAANLKKSVEKAMASAGLVAVPGSAQLVAVLTGEIKADVVGGAAVQQALSQVASVVEKSVVETVQKVNNPSSGSSGGSGSSSSSSADCGSTQTQKVVKVSDYASLSKALSEDWDVIQLSEDIKCDAAGLTVNKTITIDLNGKNITGTNAPVFSVGAKANLTVKNTDEKDTNKGKISTTVAKAIVMNDGSKLTLESGVTAYSKEESAVYLRNNATLTVNGATLESGKYEGIFIDESESDKKGKIKHTPSTVTINGGTVKGQTALYVNGYRAVGDVITINGGKIETIETDTNKADGMAMYLAGKTITNINGKSEIKGNGVGIEIRAGELYINDDAEVSSKYNKFTGTKNENGYTTDGAALAVSQHTTGHAVTVEVGKDVKLSSEAKVAVAVTDLFIPSARTETPKAVNVTINCGIGDGQTGAYGYTEGRDDVKINVVEGDKEKIKGIKEHTKTDDEKYDFDINDSKKPLVTDSENSDDSSSDENDENKEGEEAAALTSATPENSTVNQTTSTTEQTNVEPKEEKTEQTITSEEKSEQTITSPAEQPTTPVKEEESAEEVLDEEQS